MGKLVAILSAWGPAGVFLLALIDSAGIPLPVGVDALVVASAAVNPQSAYVAAALALAGSAIGCLFLFFVARKGGEAYLARYTAEGRGARLRAWFQQYGLLTVFVPALLVIPLPVKVPILSAGALGVHPARFAATILAARSARYFGLAYLGAQLGEETLPWLKAHVWHLGAAALVLFAALYFAIRLAGRRVGQ